MPGALPTLLVLLAAVLFLLAWRRAATERPIDPAKQERKARADLYPPRARR